MATPPLSPRSNFDPTTTTPAPAPIGTLEGREVNVLLPNETLLYLASFADIPTLYSMQRTCVTWCVCLTTDVNLAPLFHLLPLLNQTIPLTPEAAQEKATLEAAFEQRYQASLLLKGHTMLWDTPNYETVGQDCRKMQYELVHQELKYNSHFSLPAYLLALVTQKNVVRLIECLQLIRNPVKQLTWAQKSVLVFLDSANVTSAAKVNNAFCKWSLPKAHDEDLPCRYPGENILHAFSLTAAKTMNQITTFLAQDIQSTCSLLQSFFLPAWMVEMQWIHSSYTIHPCMFPFSGLSQNWCLQHQTSYDEASHYETILPFNKNILKQIDACQVQSIEDLVSQQSALLAFYQVALPPEPFSDDTIVQSLLTHLERLPFSKRSKCSLLANGMAQLIYESSEEMSQLKAFIQETAKYIDPDDTLNPVQLKPLVYSLADWLVYKNPAQSDLASQLLASYGWDTSERDGELRAAVAHLKQFINAVSGLDWSPQPVKP